MIYFSYNYQSLKVKKSFEKENYDFLIKKYYFIGKYYLYFNKNIQIENSLFFFIIAFRNKMILDKILSYTLHINFCLSTWLVYLSVASVILGDILKYNYTYINSFIYFESLINLIRKVGFGLTYYLCLNFVAFGNSKNLV